MQARRICPTHVVRRANWKITWHSNWIDLTRKGESIVINRYTGETSYYSKKQKDYNYFTVDVTTDEDMILKAYKKYLELEKGDVNVERS